MEPDNKAAAQAQVRGSAQFVRAAESVPQDRALRLRAERGASFLIALVLLLICVVVATVIVTSASVSVERSKQNTAEQQAYYAVSSAIKSARTFATTQGSIADLILVRSQPTDALSAGTTSDGSHLATWAVQAAQAIGKGTSAEQTTTTTVDSFTYQNATVPKVKLTYSMAPTGAEQYSITITAELDDPHDYAYKISTTVPAKIEGSTTEGRLVVHWGPKTAPSSETPDTPDTPDTPSAGDQASEAEQGVTDVWGTTHDDYYKGLWADCTWKTTGASGLLVLSDSDGYIVLLYDNGKYYKPYNQSNRDGYKGYDVGVKPNVNSAADITWKPEEVSKYTYATRRIIENGQDGDGLVTLGKGNKNQNNISWEEVTP